MIFLESNPFFDPYSYIAGNVNTKTDFKTSKSQNEDLDLADKVMSPKDYYDTQFSYYRYLNELIKYRQNKEELNKNKE